MLVDCTANINRLISLRIPDVGFIEAVSAAAVGPFVPPMQEKVFRKGYIVCKDFLNGINVTVLNIIESQGGFVIH